MKAEYPITDFFIRPRTDATMLRYLHLCFSNGAFSFMVSDFTMTS